MCSHSEKQPHSSVEAGNASHTRIGSTGQHGTDNANLQQLWEDAQAAMQTNASSDGCPGCNVQPPTEMSAAESSLMLGPMPSCAQDSASIADRVQTSIHSSYSGPLQSYLLTFQHCFVQALFVTRLCTALTLHITLYRHGAHTTLVYSIAVLQ